MAKDDQSGKSNPKSVAETVRIMNKHYAQTGQYRIEDLDRVLGDPRVGISTSVIPQTGASKRAK